MQQLDALFSRFPREKRPELDYTQNKHAAETVSTLQAEGRCVLTLYDVDSHDDDEYGPKGLCMINTNVDEEGDLREYLGDKLEQQLSLLQYIDKRDCSADSTGKRPLDGVMITVSSDADVESFIGDFDRQHALFIVEHDSDADARLAAWPAAQRIDHIAIAGDGSSPQFVYAPSGQWEELILGLVSQWIKARPSC
jgi:hypothetical protein